MKVHVIEEEDSPLSLSFREIQKDVGTTVQKEVNVPIVPAAIRN